MKLVVGSVIALLLIATDAAAQTAPRGASGRGATPAQPGRGTAPTTPATPAAAGRTSPGAGPVLVVETMKGTFELETYPTEAPKTVAHILDLVKRNFYNGQRIHRYEPGFVVQFGDPQSRDMTKRDDWGTRDSGNPIGVLEVNKKRTHGIGAVALAHRDGDPKGGDSQIYITLAARHELDSKYAVFGQVISGMDVVQKLRIPDRIIRVTVRDEAKK
jgi:cyclophilin family peptidyl-prolyl cis-trans isomerase